MKSKSFFERRMKFRESKPAKFLFGNPCRLCERPIRADDIICPECEKNIEYVEHEKICPKCRKPKKECTCNRERVYFDRVTAPFIYSGSIADAILNMKFSGHITCINFLADCMAKTTLKLYGREMDFVTYVPMFPERVKLRGFDQSRLLAKRVADAMDVPFVDNLIIKTMNNHPQSRCNMNERLGNVIGVYAVYNNLNLDNSVILLIDDICTTGSTLNECAKMLKINGARTVLALTAAIASFDKKTVDK